MFIITYKSPTALWQSASGGQGFDPGSVEGSEPLVAWGLLSMSSVIYVCLAAFIFSKKYRLDGRYYILLIPVFIDAGLSVIGGGRSALLAVVVFALLYWVYFNESRYITFRDLNRSVWLALVMPFLFLGGLVAQVLRPLLRVGIDPDALMSTVWVNINIFNLIVL